MGIFLNFELRGEFSSSLTFATSRDRPHSLKESIADTVVSVMKVDCSTAVSGNIFNLLQNPKLIVLINYGTVLLRQMSIYFHTRKVFYSRHSMVNSAGLHPSIGDSKTRPFMNYRRIIIIQNMDILVCKTI